MPDKTRGLIDKFAVTRNHDPEHKHDDCRYFVLDPQHDPIARRVLVFYAELSRELGYVQLADDLDEWDRQIWAWMTGRQP